MQSPKDQAAKIEFINDLKAKYGEISKLNAAWGTAHESWDALLESREAPDKAKAGDDLRAFYTKFAETYFRTIRDALKAVAPHQLYAGCRFAWVNNIAAEAAGKYCDIVSYNLYRRDVADFKYPGSMDKPLIIGEFHPHGPRLHRQPAGPRGPLQVLRGRHVAPSAVRRMPLVQIP